MSKFKKGDWVWEMRHGWNLVVHVFNDGSPYPVHTDVNFYTSDGRYSSNDKEASLLTVDEAADYRIPPPPKEKKTREVTYWVNRYPNGLCSISYTKEEADRLAARGRISCTKVTGIEEWEE